MPMFTNSCDNDRFLRALESIASSLTQPQIVIGPPQQMTVDWDAGIKTTCTKCEVEKPNDQFRAQANVCDECREVLDEVGFVGEPLSREQIRQVITQSCDAGPPLEELVIKMIRCERVLAHNRIRVAKYAQEQLQRPYIPLSAWAETVQKVLALLHPRAPDNAVLVELLVGLFESIQERR